MSVGYLKFAAGCLDSPIFIRPGAQAGQVIAWSDCLGDGFQVPSWSGMKQPDLNARIG